MRVWGLFPNFRMRLYHAGTMMLHRRSHCLAFPVWDHIKIHRLFMLMGSHRNIAKKNSGEAPDLVPIPARSSWDCVVKAMYSSRETSKTTWQRDRWERRMVVEVVLVLTRGVFGAPGLPLLSNLYHSTTAVRISSDSLTHTELMWQAGLCVWEFMLG